MSGTIKIKINGLNSGKILNALVDNGIFLKNIKQKSKNVTFEINENSEEDLKLICKKFHKSYEIISKNNFVNLIKKTKYYCGFVVGVVLVAALIFSFNFSVYKVNIEVEGDGQFDLANIQRVLEDNGIAPGTNKTKINNRELEKLILQTQENVAGCVVSQSGGVLNVVIYPGVLKNEVSKDNIYSKYDAVIEDVQIYAGKSNLKKGDVVRKGDLLIENNNGAAGKILAKIYYSDFIIYDENQFVRKFTGREITKNGIMIFNKNLAKPRQNIAFSEYLEENCAFCVSKNCFLPIYLTKTTYREFEYESVVVKFEEVENKLKANLLENVKIKMNGEEILNVTYSVFQENNLTRLDCFIECEIDLLA